jgi:hypothetical protein
MPRRLPRKSRPSRNNLDDITYTDRQGKTCRFFVEQSRGVEKRYAMKFLVAESSAKQ